MSNLRHLHAFLAGPSLVKNQLRHYCATHSPNLTIPASYNEIDEIDEVGKRIMYKKAIKSYQQGFARKFDGFMRRRSYSM